MYRRKAGKPVGSGFCADLFMGKACPFYPDYPSPRIDAKAHPACCDGKGCSCECIYQCSTRQDIFIKLQNKVQPALEHLADGKRLSGGADCALAHYLSGFG